MQHLHHLGISRCSFGANYGEVVGAGATLGFVLRTIVNHCIGDWRWSEDCEESNTHQIPDIPDIYSMKYRHDTIYVARYL